WYTRSQSIIRGIVVTRRADANSYLGQFRQRTRTLAPARLASAGASVRVRDFSTEETTNSMSDVSKLQHKIRAALGQPPLDLLVRNVRLVDVYRETIVETDLGIASERIVSVLPGAARAARATLDAGGQYALPGLIDAHIHIESA